MDEDKMEDSKGALEEDSRPRRRGLLLLLSAVLALGLSGLGIAYLQLQEAHVATLSKLSSLEAELWQSRDDASQLESELSQKSDELRTCQYEVADVSGSLSDAMDTIRSVESSLGLSKNQNVSLAREIDDLASQVDELSARYRSCSSSLQDAESEAARWNREAIRLAGELDECVGIANDRLQRMNACIDSANSGILWITDIPTPGFTTLFSSDPYEQLRQKYNDLVDRFNAAVDRCNDLSSLLARSLQELE